MSFSASTRNGLLLLSRIGPGIVFILGDEVEDNAAAAMVYSIT
jgi:hypothetical protein